MNPKLEAGDVRTEPGRVRPRLRRRMVGLRMRWLVWALLLVLPAACGMPRTGTLGLPGGAPSPSARQNVELVVFAAASLTEAFRQIGDRFEAEHPQTKVLLNFAGSQQLSQQIIQGAPADVFASANGSQMDLVVRAGQVAAGSEQIFAHNHLVVIYPKRSAEPPRVLADLARPGLKLDLAAAGVPAGQYALEMFKRAGQDPALGTDFSQRVLHNVVSYEENVRAVVSKVALGEADAGVVYSSDLVSADAARVGRLEVPAGINVEATYPIAALTHARHGQLANEFVAFVLGTDGQAVLLAHGFGASIAAVGAAR
ncbi:MAG: hypothetical protein NVS2B7_34480 [Herpetosiphon sp.]